MGGSGKQHPLCGPPLLPSGPVSGLGSRLTAEPLLSGKTGKAEFTPPARDLSSPGSWVSSQGLCSALLGVDRGSGVSLCPCTAPHGLSCVAVLGRARRGSQSLIAGAARLWKCLPAQ